MTQLKKKITLNSPEETDLFAKFLSPNLVAGDVILFNGSIGAGKTHLCRSIIQSLLVIPEDIPSPTFTIVQTYDTQRGELWHADLYRLTDPSELVELGLMDAFENAIVLIEWPDRLGSLQSPNALSLDLSLTHSDDARLLTINAQSNRWCFINDFSKGAAQDDKP